MTSWYIIYVLTKKQPYRGQISDCAETLLDVYKNLYDFPGVSVSTYPKNLVILSEKHVLYQDKSQNWVIYGLLYTGLLDLYFTFREMFFDF